MKKKTIISLFLLVSINSIFCVVSTGEDIIYQDHENGMDLGCFNDPNSNDLNGINDTFSQDQHVNRCFEYCDEREFYYAAIKFLNDTHYACFCGNRYGTASSELVNEKFNCSCKCSSSSCGCYNYIRVVAVRERLQCIENVGVQMGCYSFEANFSSIENQTEISCIRECHKNFNKIFSALDMQQRCSCWDTLPSLDSQTCEYYFFELKSFEIEITCPKAIFINNQYNCLIILSEPLNFRIDFGNGNYFYSDQNFLYNFSFDNYSASVSFNYTSAGKYILKANAINYQMNVQTIIYAYQNTSSSLPIESEQLTSNQKGLYLGCFYDAFYFDDRNPEIEFYQSNQMTPDLCFDQCIDTGFSYAILKNSNCYCSNTIEMNEPLNSPICDCICKGTTDEFCGCQNSFKAYNLENKMDDYFSVGSYMGCYIGEIGNVFSIAFNTNGLCFKMCKYSQFFATYNRDHCACLSSIQNMQRTDESMCNVNCPGNSSQICGSFMAARVYNITSYTIYVDFPSQVETDEIFNFSFYKTSNQAFFLNIDFDDNDLRNLTLGNENEIFEKFYTEPRSYKIKIQESNGLFFLYLEINVVDKISQSHQDYYELIENTKYVGCYGLSEFSYQFSQTDKQLCNAFCSKRKYKYSSAGYDDCKCFNNFNGIQLNETQNNCLCSCRNSPNQFCACANYFQIYEDQKNFSEFLYGPYMGCLQNVTKNNDQSLVLNFMTNHLCIKYCHLKKFKFAATFNKSECFCSNDVMDTNYLDETVCSAKCSGDNSKNCGGLIAKSVYRIFILNMTINCPSSVDQYENVTCGISVLARPTITENIEINIHFGDQTIQTYNLNQTTYLEVKKQYLRNGNFNVIAYLSELQMTVQTKIEVLPVYVYQKSNKVFGCYFDREPFEFDQMIYRNYKNMTNKECNKICKLFGFTYSGTTFEYACPCSTIYGTYNQAPYEKCHFKCLGDRQSPCGGGELRPFTVYDSDPNSIGFKTKIECTTVEVADLIKYSFRNSNYSNPIEHCVSQSKPVTIIQNNDFFCSERNYSVSGLDYSRALCDRTCFYDEHYECGGSPYYLRSVSNFNIKSPKITGDFYFEFLGCYILSTPDDFLILKNSTITNCSKYCSYLNLTIVASGKHCFCLQSINLALRVGENNCSINKVFDRHYSGQNNFYGVYKILGFNKTSVPDQNGKYTKISFGSSYFHTVITEAFETNASCFNFCLFKQHKYFAFDQQKRYCYCGNLQNFFVTNVETFIDIFMDEKSELTTEISFSSINTITNFPNLNLDTTQISSLTFNENNNLTKSNITENSTIEQLKNALYDIDPVIIAEILNKATYDISGCLVNCSNKGFCSLKDNKFKCRCKDEYFGSSCEKTTNPCDQKIQCLNNGTCIFLKDEKLKFRCECSSNFYGSHCENAIDLCHNVTCSGNGYCQEDENKEPKCKCFKYYKGDKCEEIEPALQTINTVIRTSTIIAAVVIILSFFSIFLIDITSILMKKKSKI